MDDVTLLAADGSPIGSMRKDLVHSSATPLHLAFSCHVFDDDGRMLVTRRSLGKRTWPGVWTNSFCGHPRPGEPIVDAVRRHALSELGGRLRKIECLLPDYRYRATDASGVVENELCPVHVAQIDGDIAPAPGEVLEWAWTTPSDLSTALAAAPFAFSPWLREQLPLLRAIGAA
ncbi:isopentenyl-diphosphate Delta-isomerase [Microbacterium hydrocarbonoxydans]|uniref:isopentenyl-diphosphate Delta-isomerase n=1 Tax=Microbacterium hydrocarbonoxydans TaxID=273678 RepID=UPI000A02A07A|nr:isopentenyl-diphosphate Delta-isomerase [Microbacterium hydrocarbonoxydans]